MSANLKIKPNELRNYANGMKESVSNISDILEKTTNDINSTSNSFTGSGAETLRGKYSELTTKFPDFCNAMNEYADFLLKVAQIYEESDAKISQNAENLASNYNN